LDLLARLVAVRGVTGDEAGIVAAAAEVCREVGLAVETGPDGLVLRAGAPSPEPALCFCSHLDTVPAGEGWTVPPHEGFRRHEFVYGRGAVDARASCVAIILTVAHFAAHPPAHGVVVGLLSVGEEGDDSSLPRLLAQIPTPAAAVVGEPTRMDLANRQRGLLVLAIESTGVQGHAARAVGPNAIWELARDLSAIQRLTFARVHPALGAIRLTPTRVTSGVADNVAPPVARALLDVRTTPAYTNDELVATIREAVASHVRVVSDTWRPCEIDEKQPLLACAREALPDAAVFASDAASDWVFLARAGIPALKLGPGDPQYSHAPNERIARHELEAGVAGYLRLAQTWLAGRGEKGGVDG
jgi:acetylornithine deacetylase